MTDSKSPPTALGIPNREVTYWLDHETLEYVMHDPNTDVLLGAELEDNHATQVSETKYVQYLIKCIEADPNHTLPEGVSGIIKSGVFENNAFTGAIWHCKSGKIPNGTMVSSTQIKERKPGGLVVTERSIYLVEDING